MDHELIDLLHREGAIRRSHHPRLARRCDKAIERGELVALLRGIYVLKGTEAVLAIRAVAVCLADPDAVILGEAAQALHARDQRTGPIAVVTWRLHARPWLEVHRQRIQPELVTRVGGVNLTSPELTALDLAVPTEGSSIDDALRRRVPLHQLEAADRLRGRRPGCARVRRLLAESKDEPWSPAERRAHVLLRRAGLSGWRANHPIRERTGAIIGYGDVAVTECHLIIEVDGDTWHLSPEAVLHDRARDQRLAELGWTVVRYRAHQVFHEPEAFVTSVRQLLRSHGRALTRRVA